MLIYGKQPVLYLLKHHPEMIETLYLAKEVETKTYHAWMRAGFELKRIPPKAAQSMSRGGNHQGLLAEVREYEWASWQSIVAHDFVVILSQITDVGNIGALIRSAYALGAGAVVVTGLKQVALEAVARSSTGALFDLPVMLRRNLLDAMNDLKLSGFTLYGAVMDGEDIRNMQVEGKRALILGSEGEGLSRRVEEKLDHKISIVMRHDFDSLNVSAAGAILMDRMR